MEQKIIKVALKPNSEWLWSQMAGDTLGGTTGGICHSSIMHLTETQLETFKDKISKQGGDVKLSLIEMRDEDKADYSYSCFFVKK